MRCDVFDLDHTLVKHNTSFAFFKFLYRLNLLPRRVLFDAWLARFQFRSMRLSLRDIHAIFFEKVLRGLSFEKLESVVDQFLDEFLWQSIYPPAFSALRCQQHLGSFAVLMSGSPSFLVEKIAKRFAIDHWIATEYEIDEKYRLASVKDFLDGEGKAKSLRWLSEEKGWSLSSVKAYSDSYYDLPFLLTAGRAVAVNPDRHLLFWAVQNKWDIL